MKHMKTAPFKIGDKVFTSYHDFYTKPTRSVFTVMSVVRDSLHKSGWSVMAINKRNVTWGWLDSGWYKNADKGVK